MQDAANSIRWTTADLAIFDNDRVNRYEIIDGKLFVTRALGWKHQATCIKIGAALENWSNQTGLGEPAINPGIVFSDADNVIPDVVWASYERLDRLLDEAGHLTSAPELVVEVLSPGTKNEQRDREAKLKLYSVQGVQEYWLADPMLQTVAVYRREPVLLKLGATLQHQDDLTSTLLPGFRCQVSRFF